MNIVSGEKCVLMVDPQLIDNQDIPGLERLLRKNVQLAPSNVSIYLQISEKMLKKQARMVWKEQFWPIYVKTATLKSILSS